MSVRKTMMMGGVAVATLGLSTCSDNGAVDFAPEPIDCAKAGSGGTLGAAGVLTGDALTITISQTGTTSEATWKDTPSITAVTGATPKSVSLASGGYQVVVELTVDPIMNPIGSFALSGTLGDYEGTTCSVSRTFHFKMDTGGVTVSLRDRNLPLGSRDRAAIVMTRKEGREVELKAEGVSTGAAWTATGGEVVPSGADRVTWRLPEEPGLYQIELLVDRGHEGLAYDTLTLEVG